MADVGYDCSLCADHPYLSGDEEALVHMKKVHPELWKAAIEKIKKDMVN